MAGSVHERVGGGGSSCSGGRTKGATGDTTKASERAVRSRVTTRSFRPSSSVWSGGEGVAEEFSVVDDIVGGCRRFVCILGLLLARNCCYPTTTKSRSGKYTPLSSSDAYPSSISTP